MTLSLLRGDYTSYLSTDDDVLSLLMGDNASYFLTDDSVHEVSAMPSDIHMQCLWGHALLSGCAQWALCEMRPGRVHCALGMSGLRPKACASQCVFHSCLHLGAQARDPLHVLLNEFRDCAPWRCTLVEDMRMLLDMRCACLKGMCSSVHALRWCP